MFGSQAQHPSDGQLAAAISNMVVQVMREHAGRGPNRARTHLNDDLITVALQDTLTRAERTLIDGGNTALMQAARKALQETMRADLVAGIEALTGRTVIVAFSDSSIDPDIALESFLLAPEGEADTA